MSKRTSQIDRSRREPTFLVAWRQHRGMTQDEVVRALSENHGIELSTGQFSRIERAHQPYAQDLIEALAKVYGTQTPDLLSVDPREPYLNDTPRPIVELWAELAPTQRLQAMDLLRVLVGKPRG